MTKTAGTTLLDQAAEPTAALAVRNEPDAFTQLVERLATNKDVDVVKLQALIDMQKDINRENAKAAFNQAFTNLQAELPTVVEGGKTDKGTYAQLEDIIETVRPILKTHGFSLSHKTEWPDKVTVKVIGILTHNEGHERTSEFMASADQSGSKNAIQALGSSVAYGRRYTTKDLLNIVTRNEDDDGTRSQKATAPEAPAGYDDWFDALTASADEGYTKLEKTFKESKEPFRNYLRNYEGQKLAALKAKAKKVGQ